MHKVCRSHITEVGEAYFSMVGATESGEAYVNYSILESEKKLTKIDQSKF